MRLLNNSLKLLVLASIFLASGCTKPVGETSPIRLYGNAGGTEGIRAPFTYENGRIHCALQNQSTQNDFDLDCRAMIVQRDGSEIPATSLAAGVTLEWKKPTVLEGANIVNLRCLIEDEGLSQNCALTLADSTGAKIEVQLDIHEESKGRRTESDIVSNLNSALVTGVYRHPCMNISPIASESTTSELVVEPDGTLSFIQYAFSARNCLPTAITMAHQTKYSATIVGGVSSQGRAIVRIVPQLGEGLSNTPSYFLTYMDPSQGIRISEWRESPEEVLALPGPHSLYFRFPTTIVSFSDPGDPPERLAEASVVSNLNTKLVEGVYRYPCIPVSPTTPESLTRELVVGDDGTLSLIEYFFYERNCLPNAISAAIKTNYSARIVEDIALPGRAIVRIVPQSTEGRSNTPSYFLTYMDPSQGIRVSSWRGSASEVLTIAGPYPLYSRVPYQLAEF